MIVGSMTPNQFLSQDKKVTRSSTAIPFEAKQTQEIRTGASEERRGEEIATMDPTPQAKDEDENGGLFNMDLALSDPEADNENGQGREAEKKVPRDFQSEEDFQSQLRDWRPRVERGDVFSRPSRKHQTSGMGIE
ncbi:hypothetical protein JHW43_003148 [Diplocarpon mali]|nr:hypothetical protein JHW43_003148 [Diplocarpon mali]